MKLAGGFDETSSKVGLDYYMDIYEMTPAEMIDRLKLKKFKIDEKAVIHLEYDGSIVCIYLFEEGDEVHVWGEGCYDLPFNTDGQAFLEVACKDQVLIRQFCFENSPYQIPVDDDEWDELGTTAEDVIQSVDGLKHLKPDEVIFVRML